MTKKTQVSPCSSTGLEHGNSTSGVEGSSPSGEAKAEDLVTRLRKRAEIRRNDLSRKSVQEGKPDRAADLMEEAANEIWQLQTQVRLLTNRQESDQRWIDEFQGMAAAKQIQLLEVYKLLEHNSISFITLDAHELAKGCRDMMDKIMPPVTPSSGCVFKDLAATCITPDCHVCK